VKEQERVTPSGIALPEPEGSPICILTTDTVVQINIAVPEGFDRNLFVQELADRVSAKQLAVESGDVDAWTPLQLADAHAGDEFYLTPEGAKHVIGVGHGRIDKLDPLAASKHRNLIAAAGGPLPPLPRLQR
jgi:hypothetical protein